MYKLNWIYFPSVRIFQKSIFPARFLLMLIGFVFVSKISLFFLCKNYKYFGPHNFFTKKPVFDIIHFRVPTTFPFSRVLIDLFA